jgi:hypothetical protein
MNYSKKTFIYMGSLKRIGLFFRNLKKKTKLLKFLSTNVTNGYIYVRISVRKLIICFC